MKQKKIGDCSIILISHERPIFLKKNYKFYKKFFHNIIVLDSSVKKNNFFTNKKEYQHCNKLNIIQKVALGFKKSKTKFTIISPDDDFLFPGSIIKGINFLKKNKKFISVSGKYYWFEKVGPFKKFSLMYKNGYYDVNQQTPLERLKIFCKNPLSQMTYNLFRTKEIYNCLKNFKNLKQTSFLEDVLILSPTILGKHKFLNINWMLRDGAVNTSYFNSNNQTELFNIKKITSDKKNDNSGKTLDNFIELYIKFIKKNNIEIKKKTIEKLIKVFYLQSRHPERGVVIDNSLMKLIKIIYKFFSYNIFYYRYLFYFTKEEKKYSKIFFKI